MEKIFRRRKKQRYAVNITILAMVKTTDELIELKKPDLTVDIFDLLKNRFSPRVFSNELIKQDHLQVIFEAARWAPSSYNKQPWHFFYAKKGSSGFEKLASCLLSGNEWAKEAPILILGCYIKEDERGKNPYGKYDLGQAAMSLVIQAQSLGLYSHQMGWFDKEKAKTVINLLQNYEPWVMIALGKLGDYEKSDEKLIDRDFRKRERKAKIAEEV